jgi:hypothetical protein
MLGSVVRRERLALWALLSFVAILGFAVSTVVAEAARNAALDDVVQQARDVDQILTNTVSDKQLADPIRGASYDTLAKRISRSVSPDGSAVGVTVWSSHGRVLFSLSKQQVGTIDREMRPLISEMSNGSGSYRVGDTTVRAFAPVLMATSARVALVEIDEPLAVVEARVGNVWKILRLAFALGLGVSLLLLGLTFVSSIERAAASADDEGAEHRERRAEDGVPEVGVGPEIEQPAAEPPTEQAVTEQAVTEQAVTEQAVTEQAVTEQAVTEQPTASFAQALQTLEALRPDIDDARGGPEPAQDEVPQAAASNDEGPHDSVEDDDRQDATPAHDAPGGDDPAQELMRKRREEFKARAAKAELRVKKQQAELEEAGSGPKSER